MPILHQRKDIPQLLAEIVAIDGRNVDNWTCRRGTWRENAANGILKSIYFAVHFKDIPLDMGIGLFAVHCGNRAPTDQLTRPTRIDFANFVEMDKQMRAVSPVKMLTEAKRVIRGIVSPYSSRESTVIGDIIDETYSRVNSRETNAEERRNGMAAILRTVEIKAGSVEEIVVNLAHEVAHLKQTAMYVEKPQEGVELDIFLGYQFGAWIDPDDNGIGHTAYRRNILERDADLFARSVVDNIDSARYMIAKESQLLAD